MKLSSSTRDIYNNASSAHILHGSVRSTTFCKAIKHHLLIKTFWIGGCSHTMLGVSWCTLPANLFPSDCWVFPGACTFLANLFPFAFWVFPGTLSLQISSPLLSGCFLVAPPLPISFPLLSGCFLVHYPCKSLPLSRFSDSGLTAPLVPDCLVPLSPLHGAHLTIHFALQCTHWNRHTCTLAHCLLCARQRGLKRTPWLYCTVQSFLDTFT